MRKLSKIIASALLLVGFAIVSPAQAEFKDMWAYVYSWDGTMNSIGEMNLTRETSGITFKVLQADSDTAETLYKYKDDTFTSLGNPVSGTTYADNTICNDMVRFRTDPGHSGDENVDLMVINTDGGYTTFVEDFNQYKHAIVIDERPNVPHTGMIWFGPSTAETDTGLDFQYDTQIHDVRVEVVTVDATETVDVGLLSSETSGDANGLRSLVSVATAGHIADTAVITGGSNIDYTPATTYGALLVTAITGSDAVATNGGKSYIGHVVTGANAKSLTYTGSAGSDTQAGYIFYSFTRLR